MRLLAAFAAVLTLAATAALAQPVYGTFASCAARQTTITSTTTAPSSTSAYKMQGLAGSITPGCSGTVLVTFSGTIYETSGTTATIGLLYQISYGTGTAPTNGTTLTGTQVGVAARHENGNTLGSASNGYWPFSISYVITGLSVGTAYWLDLAAESVTTASDQGFYNVSITATEMPP